VTPLWAVSRGPSDERGSVTVVTFGVVAAVLMLTVSGLLLASAVLASHRARAAADLAALAAAEALMRGEAVSTACQSASQVADLNHGRVRLCLISRTDVQLTVVVRAGVKGLGVASARSRAGPGPTLPDQRVSDRVSGVKVRD